MHGSILLKSAYTLHCLIFKKIESFIIVLYIQNLLHNLCFRRSLYQRSYFSAYVGTLSPGHLVLWLSSFGESSENYILAHKNTT